MVKPGGSAELRDPRRASVALRCLSSLCTVSRPGEAVSCSSCYLCVGPEVAATSLQDYGEVDRQHIPPLSVSHAIFSRDEELELREERREELGASSAPSMERECCEACNTCVLRGTWLHARACVKEQPIATLREAEPRAEAFPWLPTAQCNNPAIDCSPMPALHTCWALYEGRELGRQGEGTQCRHSCQQ